METSPYYWPLAKTVLAVAGPLQKFLDKPSWTHAFFIDQAIKIIGNNGFRTQAKLLSVYREEIIKGVLWADTGWKNVTHYYDPIKKKGLGNCPHALWTVQIYLIKAEKYWQKHKISQALFFLGAASHLVQDLCVPHHASSMVFSGHQAFEQWAQEKCSLFAIDSGDIYPQISPIELVIDNAQKASALLEIVKENNAVKGYREAAAYLLPLAQISTAVFINSFLSRKNLPLLLF